MQYMSSTSLVLTEPHSKPWSLTVHVRVTFRVSQNLEAESHNERYDSNLK